MSRVTKKIPVAWIYLTAWMTKDQTVHFRNDVYAQDEQLLEATAEEARLLQQGRRSSADTRILVAVGSSSRPGSRG